MVLLVKSDSDSSHAINNSVKRSGRSSLSSWENKPFEQRIKKNIPSKRVMFETVLGAPYQRQSAGKNCQMLLKLHKPTENHSWGSYLCFSSTRRFVSTLVFMTMEFFLPRMESKSVFLSLLLCYSVLRAADSHMVIEEKTECNLSRSNKMNLPDLPPISIVG